MYPAKPGLLIGFHGCEEAVRNEVIAGKRVLNPSKNRHDWLGSGIYFWENNYMRAMDFAKNPPGKRKFESPCVLGAVIDLQFCLDLLDTADLGKVKFLHLTRIESGLKPFDSVRGVFIEGQALYPGAGFHDKNHIQICIRNPNCIKGFFLPRVEVSWN
jgi:hypothetical protein